MSSDMLSPQNGLKAEGSKRRQLTFHGDSVKMFDRTTNGPSSSSLDREQSNGVTFQDANHGRRHSTVRSNQTAINAKRAPSNGKPEWYSDLSEEQVMMFKQVFELLDKDGDHTLDTDELFELLDNLDVCLSKDEISAILKELDSDGNGVIDFMEFLYAMAMSDKYIELLSSEDPDVSDRQKPGGCKYSKRQSLFFTAITKFAMKNSLSDVERYYTAKARHAPHVIAHYTAGARVIGLTDRQMERHYATLEKNSTNPNSPYAKPLQFVTMIDNEKAKVKSNQIRMKIGQNSVKIRQPKSSQCKGRRSAIAHDDDEMNTLLDALNKLAEDGSVIAKIPEVHLIKPLRNKIASGEMARELEQVKQRKLHALVEHHDESYHELPGVTLAHGHEHVHHGRTKRQTPHYNSKDHGKHGKHGIASRHKNPRSASISPALPTRQQRHVKKAPTKHKQPGWQVPSIAKDRIRVKLPFIRKNDVESLDFTVDDLAEIRKRVAKTLNVYYDKLRWRTVHCAWEHWGELHVDQFPSDYLRDNFRSVYQAYSPHTCEEAFVIAPWIPPPFPGGWCSARAEKKEPIPFSDSRPATSMF